MTDSEPHLEIEVERDGETSTLTVPSGADVTLTVPAREGEPEDTDTEDDMNGYQTLGGMMFGAGVIIAISAPFTSVPFRTQATFSLIVLALSMGVHAIGDIREYGEVPDPREQEYSVPDDPTDLLGGDDDE